MKHNAYGCQKAQNTEGFFYKTNAMKKYHQRIRGKLSENFIQKINFNIAQKDDNEVLFLDFSGFTISVGSKFNYLIIENEKYSIEATLTFVTQQYKDRKSVV